MSNYKMIVMDMDDTLITSDNVVSPETKDYLIQLQEEGYKIVLASGRPTEGMIPVAKELKLEDQVIFHGFLSHTELTKLYQKMDLAVLSSYSESFPLVLLEAGDNELPLLSTTVGDIKKLIPDDEYGFIVNIGDEVALSDQLVNISKLSKKQLQMIAKKEKKYLANTFSIYNQLAEIDQGYQLLMK